MPTLPNSVRTAGFILLALLAYFVFRAVTREAPVEPAANSVESQSEAATKPLVIVRQVDSQPHDISVSLKGRTEPDRIVIVRSETAGIVKDAPAQEGQSVQRGALLCGLNIESRAARIAEAEAAVASARLEHESAETLEAKGWTTSNRAAATKATLDRAEAALAAARVEIGKTKIRAPFSGVFETRMAEIGDFLAPGAACGQIVDLDPIVVVVDATEDQRAALTLNAPVTAQFSNGTQAVGTLRYIARSANELTRTFRIEVAVPNEDSQIAAGITASVMLHLGTAPAAVLLSPASLVLHDDGRIGVRYVDSDNFVRFAPVQIIDDSDEGVWVTGLPENVNLLATGQDYLRAGVEVEPSQKGS